jgi:hypothetical protein
MKLFSLLFILFLSSEAKTSLRKMKTAKECQSATITAAGKAPNSVALPPGANITWEFPIYVDGTTEVGDWEGNCVGLGANVDPAGGQNCAHIYVFDENGGLFKSKGDEGSVTGTCVYHVGEPSSMIVITGGSGSYQNASGAVNVTFANGTYTHAFNICF